MGRSIGNVQVFLRHSDDAVSAQQIAQADIKTAQAQVRQARLNLSYTHVDAPISGIVGRAQKTEGTLVSGTDVLLATKNHLLLNLT